MSTSYTHRVTHILLLAASLVGLTACSSDGESATGVQADTTAMAGETTAAATTPASTVAASTAAASTVADVPATSGPESTAVTIEHLYGTTVIESTPARIVALSQPDADTAVALGVVPVAMAQSLGVAAGETPPWFDAPGVEVLDVASGWPFEKIAELNPDLIVGMYTAMTAEDYAILAEIAPTIAPQTGLYQDRWEEIVNTVGVAVGQPDAAATLVDEATGYIDAVADKHPEYAGKTVVITDLAQPGVFLVLADPEESTVSMFNRLGFELPAAIAELERDLGFAATVSDENIELMEANLLIFAAASPETLTTYQNNPLFEQLDVVKRDAAINMDLSLFAAIRQPSPLSIPYAVDNIEQLLTEVDLG